MNFDYVETIKQAAQITWRRKFLWGVMLLPMLPIFIMFPLFFAAALFLEENSSEAGGIYMVIAALIFGLLLIASFFFTAYAQSATTLGIIRSDRGDEKIQFAELLQDAVPFYGRSLGLLLVLQLTVGLIFSIIFLFIALMIFVTMGIGAICAQPILMLLTPFSLLFVSFMEAAQTSLLAENLGVVDALKRAWQVMREHVWKYVIITLIVYFGASILSSFVFVPLMIPMFLAGAFVETASQSASQMGFAIFAAMMCFFFPVMLLFSSITQVFMKACLDLTYLRLAVPQRKTENQVIFSE